jgi:hypothetical protein
MIPAVGVGVGVEVDVGGVSPGGGEVAVGTGVQVGTGVAVGRGCGVGVCVAVGDAGGVDGATADGVGFRTVNVVETEPFMVFHVTVAVIRTVSVAWMPFVSTRSVATPVLSMVPDTCRTPSLKYAVPATLAPEASTPDRVWAYTATQTGWDAETVAGRARARTTSAAGAAGPPTEKPAVSGMSR